MCVHDMEITYTLLWWNKHSRQNEHFSFHLANEAAPCERVIERLLKILQEKCKHCTEMVVFSKKQFQRARTAANIAGLFDVCNNCCCW